MLLEAALGLRYPCFRTSVLREMLEQVHTTGQTTSSGTPIVPGCFPHWNPRNARNNSRGRGFKVRRGAISNWPTLDHSQGSCSTDECRDGFGGKGVHAHGPAPQLAPEPCHLLKVVLFLLVTTCSGPRFLCLIVECLRVFLFLEARLMHGIQGLPVAFATLDSSRRDASSAMSTATQLVRGWGVHFADIVGTNRCKRFARP